MTDLADTVTGRRDDRPAMTDPAARADTLGLRLALAFLGVALAAVALLAGLTAAFSAADVSNLARHQRADLTSAIAIAAGATYARNDSWQAAELSPVLDLAARTGADVAIQDRSGQTVIASRGFGTNTGAQSSAPITVDGARIGQVVVRSTGSGLGAADRTLADRAAPGDRGRGRPGRPAGPDHRADRGPADHPAGHPPDRGDPGHGQR